MYEYRAKVIRVIDGDTLKVDIDLGFTLHIQQTVRLYGINCPETRTKDVKEKEKGLMAKYWIEQLLLNKEIIIQTKLEKNTKEFDSFGRVLATIIYNEVNINEDMVKRGYAKRFLR